MTSTRSLLFQAALMAIGAATLYQLDLNDPRAGQCTVFWCLCVAVAGHFASRRGAAQVLVGLLVGAVVAGSFVVLRNVWTITPPPMGLSWLLVVSSLAGLAAHVCRAKEQTT